MEGGSPAAIWERWTLPMLYAQRRYWQDHPPASHWLRLIASAHFKLPRATKTPRRTRGTPRLDRDQLQAPLSAAELAAWQGRGKTIR
jgi:hypothetical protein